MNLITERALRAAIIFWDEKWVQTGNDIFKSQANDAVQELVKHGHSVKSIVRRS